MHSVAVRYLQKVAHRVPSAISANETQFQPAIVHFSLCALKKAPQRSKHCATYETSYIQKGLI